MDTELRSRGDAKVCDKLDGEKEVREAPPVGGVELGRGDQPSILNLFTLKGEEGHECLPPTWTPEVYETLFIGPKALIGDALDRDLRGMIAHPKGLLPKSLFRIEYNPDEMFYRELFFSLRHMEDLVDEEAIYLAKFTPNNIWPTDWERHQPEIPQEPEIPQLDDKRLPPIRSHARGFSLTRGQLDRLDGLQKLKQKQFIDELNKPRLPPFSSHARGLGLTMDYLDRLDGVMPVLEKVPDIIFWKGSPQISPPSVAGLVPTANTIMETDCTDGVLWRITDQIMADQAKDRHQGDMLDRATMTVAGYGKRDFSVKSGRTEQTKPEPRKKRFVKRMLKYMRTVFSCVCKKSKRRN